VILRIEIFYFAGEFGFKEGSVEKGNQVRATQALLKAFQIICGGITDGGNGADAGSTTRFIRGEC